MALYLLDTDAVIDHLNGYEPTTSLLVGLLDAGDLLATNAVVVAEVHSGLAAEGRILADEFLSELQFLELTPSVARRAGDLRHDAARRGHTLALADVLNAASALEHGATLVTGNMRHYRPAGVPTLALPR